MMQQDVLKEIENAVSDMAGDKRTRIISTSIHKNGRYTACMAELSDREVFLSQQELGFDGSMIPAVIDGNRWLLSETDHSTALRMRQLFPFTAPSRVLREKKTIGVGDRLGIAASGHIMAFRDHPEFVPVLAQQSVRELTLTGRNFGDVLDAASFAVFREDYQCPFGADGDHLKHPEEIEEALAYGYTMITLDCSDHIRNEFEAADIEDVNKAFDGSPEEEAYYLDREFCIGNTVFRFTREEYRRMYLIYHEAIDFAARIYHRFFENDRADLEISIDETAAPTTPDQHYYIANELFRRNVCPASMAPRFCGEFQKGIDYIGDIRQFREELRIHQVIADHFGYKISVHSGSDKFSIFPSVAELTGGHFHLKTAGTNWLEAMKVIAFHDPVLFRRVHTYALNEAFEKARQYYHITPDLLTIPDIGTLRDDELPELFSNDAERQVLHVCYGHILTALNCSKTLTFKTDLYRDWRMWQYEYNISLRRHIGHHMDKLFCSEL